MIILPHICYNSHVKKIQMNDKTRCKGGPIMLEMYELIPDALGQISTWSVMARWVMPFANAERQSSSGDCFPSAENVV